MSVASTPVSTRFDQIGRWLQLLLVLSLAVNLLVAGAVMGGAWVLRQHHGFEPMRGAGPVGGPGVGPIGKFIGTLSPERRSALHDVIAQYETASREFNKTMAGARHEAADALAARPFDHARFETAIRHVYDAEVAGRTAMIPTTGQVVDHLSDGERQDFLRMLKWQQGMAVDNKMAESPTGTKAP